MIDERKKLERCVIERRTLTDSERADYKQRQKAIADDTSSGTYLPHVYRVFEDPDFQKDTGDLRSLFEDLYYKDVSLTVEYEDEHLLLEDKLVIKELANKYMITLDDLGAYADGYYEDGVTNIGRRLEEFGGFRIVEIDGYHRPVYVIGTKTSLKTIKRDWPYVREARHDFLRGSTNQNGLTRSKSPDNPDLIFAIFKARLINNKFSDIFSAYENRKLAGFSGSHSQFKNEESLERYYRKYAPQLQANVLSLLYP